MAVEDPGTRTWLTRIKAEWTTPLPAGKGVPLGGVLHKRAVDYRIKPGTRAYRAALVAAATPT